MRYLLITFMRKPNGQIDEQVAVSKKVKAKDMCEKLLANLTIEDYSVKAIKEIKTGLTKNLTALKKK